MKTTAALRLLYFVAEADRPKLSAALFRAYWVEGKNIGERSTLVDAVKQSCGVEDSQRVLRGIETGSFEGDEQRRELESATHDAVQRGSPGVPGFWIPGKVWTDKEGARRRGRLYWGQDRMHFVEAVLIALNEGRTGDEIAKISRPLRSLIPRSTRSGIRDGEEVKLEFWYDFSSPWAFLGWTQLQTLKRQYGEKLQIDMKPFLLGILFREIGAPDTPGQSVSVQKQRYNSLDHADWVRFWNAVNEQNGKPDEKIDFYWADKFPIRTPTVLRMAMVEPKLVPVLCKYIPVD